MPSTHRFTTLFLALCSASGCSSEERVFTAPNIHDGDGMMQGTIELPTTVYAENPRTKLLPNERHTYALPIAMGGPSRVRLTVTTANPEAAAPEIALFEKISRERIGRAWGPDAAPNHEAELTMELPGGDYTIVVATDGEPGSYRLEAWCEDGPCTPENQTLAWTKDNATSASGKLLFNHIFRLREGLGNGRQGAQPPNFNRIHHGKQGGPDGQSCISCHNQNGPDGSGGHDDNIFQGGNGQIALRSFHRNPPSLRGAGIREAIAAQITAELQAIEAVEGPTKLCFTSLDGDICPGTIDEDGEVIADFEVEGEVEGTRFVTSRFFDDDRVIEPFGWKGRDITVRDFVLGGFRVHFGIEAWEKVELKCNGDEEVDTDFTEAWGSGPACDPDGDGKEKELTKKQLDAMSVYLLGLDPPPASDPDKHAEGRKLFEDIGCQDCHTRGYRLDSRDYTVPETSITVTLPSGEGGDYEYEVWSDFLRHDIGYNPDFQPFPNDEGTVGPFSFITPPLWDLANTAPYMHDGEAKTIEEAIMAHEREADDSRKNYEDLLPEQSRALLEFLESLGARDDY